MPSTGHIDFTLNSEEPTCELMLLVLQDNLLIIRVRSF
jgi:hypothetical protein